MGRNIIKAAFAKARIEDDGRLGSHSLRKTWAMNLLRASNNSVLLVYRGLNHASIETTQRYLSVGEDELMMAMQKYDFTRGPRKQPRIAVVTLLQTSKTGVAA